MSDSSPKSFDWVQQFADESTLFSYGVSLVCSAPWFGSPGGNGGAFYGRLLSLDSWSRIETEFRVLRECLFFGGLISAIPDSSGVVDFALPMLLPASNGIYR